MADDLRAAEIAEELLYVTGLALSGRSTDEAVAHFEVPQIVETTSGKHLVETEDDVRNTFSSVRDYFAKNGIREVVRTVISAEFLSETIIAATHVSQLVLSDGTPFRAPYPSYVILRWSRGRWRIASTMHAIIDDADHVAALNAQMKPFDPWVDSPNVTPNGGNAGRPRL